MLSWYQISFHLGCWKPFKMQGVLAMYICRSPGLKNWVESNSSPGCVDGFVRMDLCRPSKPKQSGCDLLIISNCIVFFLMQYQVKRSKQDDTESISSYSLSPVGQKRSVLNTVTILFSCTMRYYRLVEPRGTLVASAEVKH